MEFQDQEARYFAEETNVSRETFQTYETWRNLLTHWNKKINLVSASTIDQFWTRHALDSHQLFALAPVGVKTWIDLGSGAGFPGLAMAIALRDKADASVMMVESNGKKCNFLRAVTRELGLPAQAQQVRAEDLPPAPYDVISARAFAPLPKLLAYSARFWGEDTIGIFPKGAGWKNEVDAAELEWSFSVETRESKTDADAKILIVKNLTPLEANKRGKLAG